MDSLRKHLAENVTRSHSPADRSSIFKNTPSPPLSHTHVLSLCLALFIHSEPTGVTDRYHRGGLYRDGQRNGFEGTMMGKRLADSRSFDEHKRTTRAIIELTSEDEDENDGEGDSEGGGEDVNGASTSTSSPTATRTATLTTSPTTTDSTGVDLNKRISLSPADLHKLHGSCSDDPDLDLGLGHDFDLT